MKTFALVAAMLLVAASTFLGSAPAQAFTAHQYQELGKGRYVSSKSRMPMSVRHYHRHRRHR